MIDSYNDQIKSWLRQLDLPTTPQNLYDPLHYFLDLGGKRIRPVLAMLAGELFHVEYSKTLPAALSVELFHNFSLIHDDIMDEAPLRRGKETVHTHWNRDIAILSGDVLFVKAYQQLEKASDTDIPALLRIFNKTAVEVCEGQQMDMDFELRSDVTKEEYLEMIRLKTSVLLGCSLQMGAICAGASQEQQELLYNFGVKIGIAFQIQDDILDLYGNPETFGKQVGGDVFANKKTLLYLSAQEMMAQSDFKQLVLGLFDQPNNQTKIDVAKQLFETCGAKKSCEALMKTYYAEALSILNQLEVPNLEAKNRLHQIAALVIERMN